MSCMLKLASINFSFLLFNRHLGARSYICLTRCAKTTLCFCIHTRNKYLIIYSQLSHLEPNTLLLLLLIITFLEFSPGYLT